MTQSMRQSVILPHQTRYPSTNLHQLIYIVNALVADHKGILAMDESEAICNKRFAAVGIPQTVESRREFREMIVTTPELRESISGAILSDESIRQKVLDDIPMPEALTMTGIIQGIAFLSDGQSPKLASARLNAMNLRFRSRKPWKLTFSFARAIQQPALEIWSGFDENIPAAQQAILHRARCNGAASSGDYGAAMERQSE